MGNQMLSKCFIIVQSFLRRLAGSPVGGERSGNSGTELQRFDSSF